MKRSPRRTARPAIPPATPPAIAAAFELEADPGVDLRAAGLVSAGWPAVVAAGLLYRSKVDVGEVCECLAEELLVLEIEATVASWTRFTTYEKGPRVRFACGQS